MKYTLKCLNPAIQWHIQYQCGILTLTTSLPRNLGAVKNENTLELKLPGNGEGGDVIKTSTAAPLLPGSEEEERGEVQTDKKLSSCLVQVVGVWHLKKLFRMMKEDGSIKIPVDEAR